MTFLIIEKFIFVNVKQVIIAGVNVHLAVEKYS